MVRPWWLLRDDDVFRCTSIFSSYQRNCPENFPRSTNLCQSTASRRGREKKVQGIPWVLEGKLQVDFKGLVYSLKSSPKSNLGSVQFLIFTFFSSPIHLLFYYSHTRKCPLEGASVHHSTKRVLKQAILQILQPIFFN